MSFCRKYLNFFPHYFKSFSPFFPLSTGLISLDKCGFVLNLYRVAPLSRLSLEKMEWALLQIRVSPRELCQALVRELIGSCLLIVTGCGSVLAALHSNPESFNLTGVSLCWGIIVATLALVIIFTYVLGVLTIAPYLEWQHLFSKFAKQIVVLGDSYI